MSHTSSHRSSHSTLSSHTPSRPASSRKTSTRSHGGALAVQAAPAYSIRDAKSLEHDLTTAKLELMKARSLIAEQDKEIEDYVLLLQSKQSMLVQNEREMNLLVAQCDKKELAIQTRDFNITKLNKEIEMLRNLQLEQKKQVNLMKNILSEKEVQAAELENSHSHRVDGLHTQHLMEHEEKSLHTQNIINKLDIMQVDKETILSQLQTLQQSLLAAEAEHNLEMELEKDTFENILSSTTKEYEHKLLKVEDEKRTLVLALEREKHAFQAKHNLFVENEALINRLNETKDDPHQVKKLAEDLVKAHIQIENLQVQLNVIKIEHEEEMREKLDEIDGWKDQVEDVQYRADINHRELKKEVNSRRMEKSARSTEYEKLQDNYRDLMQSYQDMKTELRRKTHMFDKLERATQEEHKEMLTAQGQVRELQQKFEASKKVIQELQGVASEMKSTSKFNKDELDFQQKEKDRLIAMIKELEKTVDIQQHAMQQRKEELRVVQTKHSSDVVKIAELQDRIEQLEVDINAQKQENLELTDVLKQVNTSNTQHVSKAQYYQEQITENEATMKALEHQLLYHKDDKPNRKWPLVSDATSVDCKEINKGLQHILREKLNYKGVASETTDTIQLLQLVTIQCEDMCKVTHTFKNFVECIGAMVWDHEQDDDTSDVSSAGSSFDVKQFLHKHNPGKELTSRLESLLRHVQAILRKALKKGLRVQHLEARLSEAEMRDELHRTHNSEDDLLRFMLKTRPKLMQELFVTKQLSTKLAKQLHAFIKTLLTQSVGVQRFDPTTPPYLKTLLVDIIDKLTWMTEHCSHPTERKYNALTHF